MLNKLRSFSRGKLATVLVGIIIIPFVFWGMGGVFSSGNTNTIVKINNTNISTKDFVEYINDSRLSTEYIQENINNNILEELLSELISNRLVDLEIKKFNIFISEKTLAAKIKSEKNFLDKKKIFSRIKYEKFLLENNLSAVEFEAKFKKNEIKKNLFKYISGGIQAPHFMINKLFKDQNKLVTLSYLNLNNLYKKKNELNINEINNYLKQNEESLKKEFINFNYVKITPENLIQETEYTNNYFSKIDEIENQILNGSNIQEIASNFKLKLSTIKNYIDDKNDDLSLKKIYEKRNENKIQIIEENDFFLLYEINKIEKILPNKNNLEFINSVKNKLIEKYKLDYNKDLLIKIQNKNFTDNDFLKLGNNGELIKSAYLETIKDDRLFTFDSMKLIYSLPRNSFLLVTDNKKNIYLAKIDEIFTKDISQNQKNFMDYNDEANIKIKDDLYSSYDFLVNSKYKIKVNQQTLDRVKNYFQ